ncbi:hypothetical protein [Deinococcus misasensis]|uniref:hypothetical protein n=1 Tax=Deinococcus misasensis TaxID=392413 RepID=UPI000550B505|nr:hypothetical protein [Deinococcus misasensis]
MDYPLEAPVVFDLGHFEDYQDVAVPVPWVEVKPCSDLSGDSGDCGYVRVVQGAGGQRVVLLTWRKN